VSWLFGSVAERGLDVRLRVWWRGAMRLNAYLSFWTCVAVAWALDQLVERRIA
jgi:hypothetical protein